MDFKILFSDEALNDLDEIVESIAGDNPDAASRVAQSIIDHVKVLQYFPRVGTIIPRRRATRRLVHTPYIVYYRIHENRRVVEILHFWHGSRRQTKL